MEANEIGKIWISGNKTQVGMMRFPQRAKRNKRNERERVNLPVAMRSFEFDKVIKLPRPLFALIPSETLRIRIIIRLV